MFFEDDLFFYISDLFHALFSLVFFKRVWRRSRGIVSKLRYLYLSLADKVTLKILQLRFSHSQREKFIDELEVATNDGYAKIFITIPVRKLGNPHSYFRELLLDLEATAACPEMLKLYITVDYDDDLPYFLKLKKEFENRLFMRFFVWPAKADYQGTVNLHSMMIAKNQAKFDVWLLGSSDAMPTSYGWDINILNSIANAPSTIFFGGGPASRANKIHGPFPEKHIPIYWVGTDDFPVASEKAIKTLQSLTKAFPGWTAVGDTWHIDGFFGEIVRHLWNIGRNDMFIEIPQFFKERNPRGWLNNPNRETARYKVLVSFFNKDKQAIFEQLAKRLDDACKAHKLSNSVP